MDQIERMKAIIAQAVAEAERGSQPLTRVHLLVYGDTKAEQVEQWFQVASRGTPAEAAEPLIESAGSRYICWNCCGLRFEGHDDVCPNCGEVALTIPEEIAFALKDAVQH
jgi:Zn finger protein HypA/HybF involved in hydrogenase expression